MTMWPADVRHHWFPIALSKSLTTRPITRDLFGAPVALARTEAGDAIALQDRCPHRHAPLSAGRISPRGLECPYHGWTFGADGACTLIPGLEQACSAQPRVASYAITERDGLVWIAPRASANRPLSALVQSLDPSERRFLWQTLWHAPIVDCLENFLDALHTHYVHAGLVRQAGGRRRVAAELTTTGDGFEVDYRGVNVQSGLLFRLFESERTSERALFGAPSTAQIEYRYRNGSRVRITLYFAPATGTTTHVFTSLHVSGRWAPAWAVRLFVWPFLHRVASQDARMLKLQTRNRERFGFERFASTPADLVRPYLEHVWSTAPPRDLPSSHQVELSI